MEATEPYGAWRHGEDLVRVLAQEVGMEVGGSDRFGAGAAEWIEMEQREER